MIKRWIFRGVICLILMGILTLGNYGLFQQFMIIFAMVSLDITIEGHLLGGNDKE